ncbi:MAG TPA: Rid family hydrolase [Thermoanaerobaculia bacterium]|jgi:enamine deaminase RidA (YjgF/YER057c/UK114 family)
MAVSTRHDPFPVGEQYRGIYAHGVETRSGVTFADIVKMSFFLMRREDMDTLVEVRKELLDGVRPAITTVFVAGLVSPDWLVEVEVVACAE